MFFQNNSNQSKGKNALILDISSASVGVAIVKNFKGRGKTPLVLKTYRTPINFTENVDYKSFVTKSKIAIQKSIEKIINSDNNFGKIDQIRIFYAPPWYKTSIKKLIKDEKTPKPFTTKYLCRLLKEYAEVNDNKILKVDDRIISVKLNGYDTSKPEGKIMKNLALTKYESLIGIKIHNNVLEIINQYVNCVDIKFTTHPYSVYKVLNEKFSYKKTYTIVDVGGEVTEITIIRNNDFEKIISIPIGTQFVVRELSKKNKTDLNTVYEKLINKEDSLIKNDDSGFVNSLNEVKKDWLEQIKKTIELNKIKSLPADIFLIADNNFQKIMYDILNDVNAYYNTFRFGRRPNINLINSRSITDLANYQLGVKKDAFISMEAGFLEITE